MSTVTTIGVVDLLTIRECIEILVDGRTGRDRTPSLPPAVVDYLGAAHVRPRAWTDEAKDLLRQALIAGQVGLYASRKIGDGANVVSDAFVRIPSENLDRSRHLDRNTLESSQVVKIAKPTVETIEGTPDLEQFVW
jgi:hypothetical protein